MSDVRSPEEWGDAPPARSSLLDNAVALTRYRASIETAINTLIGNRVER